MVLDHRKMLASFDEFLLRDLLLRAAVESELIREEINRYHGLMIHGQPQVVIHFDHHSKKVWHELQHGQIRHGQNVGSSKQYELALEVSNSVRYHIADIRRQTPANSSFGTKKSALETLRKIGKSLSRLEYDEFGARMAKCLHEAGDPQEKVMLGIVKEMTAVERINMGDNTEWIGRIEELIELDCQYQLYGRLNEMLEMLGLGETEDQGQAHETEEESLGETMATPIRADKERNRKVARYNICHGCGCGDARCSSCWLSEDELEE